MFRILYRVCINSVSLFYNYLYFEIIDILIYILALQANIGSKYYKLRNRTFLYTEIHSIKNLILDNNFLF